MRFRFLPLFLFFLSAPLTAQIVVQQAAFKAALESGVRSYSIFAGYGMAFDPGAPGSTDNEFHFENITFTPSFVETKYADPAGSPYASSFPDATYYTPDQGNGAYYYYRLTNDSWELLGMIGTIQGITATMDMAPDMPVYEFPLKLGDSWTYTSAPMNVLPAYGLSITYHVESEIVGAGKVYLPEGEYDCLVMKRLQAVTTDAPSYTAVSHILNYQIIRPNGLSVNITIDTTSIGSDTLRMSDMTLERLKITPVEPAAVAPRSFGIDRVYPNPVTSGTAMVQWEAPTRAECAIRVYDIRGREVARAFDGEAAPGTHSAHIDLSGMPAGMYFVRLTAPDGFHTAKIVRTE